MRRCFVNAEYWHGDAIMLPDSEAHHLLHVLRIDAGERVCVFDGKGREAVALVRRGEDGSIELTADEIRDVVPRAFALTLICAVVKGSRGDVIFEKATELGVARIIPVMTERVVVRFNEMQAAKRVKRWNRIAASAAKQCGTPWLPKIDNVSDYHDVLAASRKFDAVLIGSLSDGSRPLKDVAAELHNRTEFKSLAVIIGPEGDLTADEERAALEAGAIPVSFGGLTLRAETAALYAASVLAYEFLW